MDGIKLHAPVFPPPRVGSIPNIPEQLLGLGYNPWGCNTILMAPHASITHTDVKAQSASARLPPPQTKLLHTPGTQGLSLLPTMNTETVPERNRQTGH